MPLSVKSLTFRAMQKTLLLTGLVVICYASSIAAWSPHRQLFSRILFSSHSHETTFRFSGSPNDNDFVCTESSSSSSSDVADADAETETSRSVQVDTRRRFLNAAAMNIGLVGGLVVAGGAPAAVVAASDSNPPGTKYISGKKPIPPGETAKKSDNPKGTRKDPDFLRSVSDCRSQCQSTPGPDGFAKSKEDCLSECQDICCTTYEQCTFNIVPRL